MLVLTRCPGDTLHIGEKITVTILGAKGNQVRIGIQAPPEVVVLREELIAAKADETPPPG